MQESANIYRVNKLLEIEHVDWERQLDRAVSGFYFSLSYGSFPALSRLVWPLLMNSLTFRVSRTNLCRSMRPAAYSTDTKQGLETPCPLEI